MQYFNIKFYLFILYSLFWIVQITLKLSENPTMVLNKPVRPANIGLY